MPEPRGLALGILTMRLLRGSLALHPSKVGLQGLHRRAADNLNRDSPLVRASAHATLPTVAAAGTVLPAERASTVPSRQPQSVNVGAYKFPPAPAAPASHILRQSWILGDRQSQKDDVE